MVKIPLAKNSLAIDHRALQTGHNVSHEANPEAGVNQLPMLGAWLQSWELRVGSDVPHGAPQGGICTCGLSEVTSPRLSVTLCLLFQFL